MLTDDGNTPEYVISERWSKDQHIPFAMDHPLVEWPAEQPLGQLRRRFDVSGVRNTLQFGDNLERVLNVFENVRCDHIIETFILKRECRSISNHKRASIEHDLVPTGPFRVVPRIPVTEDVGAFTRSVAASDFEYTVSWLDVQHTLPLNEGTDHFAFLITQTPGHQQHDGIGTTPSMILNGRYQSRTSQTAMPITSAETRIRGTRRR